MIYLGEEETFSNNSYSSKLELLERAKKWHQKLQPCADKMKKDKTFSTQTMSCLYKKKGDCIKCGDDNKGGSENICGNCQLLEKN